MKTLVHTLTVTQTTKRQMFKISLPRNAKSIVGVMVRVRNVEKFNAEWRREFTGYYSENVGTVWMNASNEQGCFYSQDLNLLRDFYNQDFLKPINGFFFPNGEGWYHGKRDEFLSIDVPLKCHQLEGYFEGNVPFIFELESYEVKIYLKLSLS